MLNPTRARTFTVVLLKDGVSEADALTSAHRLGVPVVDAKDLPSGATLHVGKGHVTEPWWRTYLGLPDPLNYQSYTAIMFLPVRDRMFAVCFGNVGHNLVSGAVVQDFGLITTLNCVDPAALKNTDVARPSTATRVRTQLSAGQSLSSFDFDSDMSVLKNLSGAVRDEYQDLFKNVSGSASFKFSAKVKPDTLTTLCDRLLDVYELEDYKTTFPEVTNITPVREVEIVDQLDAALIPQLQDPEDPPLLSIPDALDSERGHDARFSGHGASEIYPDLYLGAYLDYLEKRAVDNSSIDVDMLKKDKLVILNDDETAYRTYSIYNSLLANVKLIDDDAHYHLMDGAWWRFEASYVKNITSQVNEIVGTGTLPACTEHNERDYNITAAHVMEGALLDRTSISPKGETAVEPCDIAYLENDHVVLSHVKISTAASALSHLAMQGANSLKLILSNAEAEARVLELVTENAPAATRSAIIDALEAKRVIVEYAVITHKSAEVGAENLPIFSRITFANAAADFRTTRTVMRLVFVTDDSPDRGTRKKTRAKRKSTGNAAQAAR